MVEEESEHKTFTFFDGEHQDSALKALNMMRKNKHFCDVILHVGNTEVHAHRCVLASASPYLLELFTTDQDKNLGKSENIITYKLNGGFDKFALKRLVEYAYTSQLEISDTQVKSVYLAACQLKMERVVKECIRHLIKNLNIENCIETRSLPGIAKNREFVLQVDHFIADHFDNLAKNKVLLSLNCVQVEILSQTRQEMSLGNPHSLCHLVLDWIKRQVLTDQVEIPSLYEKMHMLYLAMDNSLQDCSDLPSEDVSNTEMVRDYKKLSLKNGPPNSQKNKRKCLGQPSKPRVLIYSRDIGVEDVEQEFDKDWNLIASSTVAEHTFLALVTLSGRLTTLSVQLRLNPPTLSSVPNTPGAVANSGSRTPPEFSLSQQQLINGGGASTISTGSNYTSSVDGSDTPISTCSTGPDSDFAAAFSYEQEPDLYCAVAPMSFAKCAAGCLGLKDALIVCGGYDRVECLKTVESYIPITNTWISLPNMRENRGRFQIALINGVVYALGGSNGHTELNSVEQLDLSVNPLKWQKSIPMPLARSNHGACTFENRIYCVGGWNGQAGIKQCDIFDPKTNSWNSIASLNTGRHQAGVAAYHSMVWAIGGTDNWNCLNSVEIYNPEQNNWMYAKPINTPRRGCGVCVFNDKLYVIGGSDGTSSLSTTEIFDEDSNTWIVGPSMTTPRANVAVAVVGNRLYAVGGFSGKTFLNSIEYLDEFSNEWTTFIPKTRELNDELEIQLDNFKYNLINGSAISHHQDNNTETTNTTTLIST